MSTAIHAPQFQGITRVQVSWSEPPNQQSMTGYDLERYREMARDRFDREMEKALADRQGNDPSRRVSAFSLYSGGRHNHGIVVDGDDLKQLPFDIMMAQQEAAAKLLKSHFGTELPKNQFNWTPISRGAGWESVLQRARRQVMEAYSRRADQAVDITVVDTQA